MNYPELHWTVKQWMPGITTFKQAGGERSVLVGFSGGPVTYDSGYTISHQAAARDAIQAVAASMEWLADALRQEELDHLDEGGEA